MLGELGPQMVQRVVAYLPNVLAATALLALGYLLAVLARLFVRRVVSVAVEKLVRRRAAARVLEHSSLNQRIPRLTGGTVYWVILLFFIAAATERLELAILTTLAGNVAAFLPRILLGGLIVLAGFLAGNLAYAGITAAASSTRGRNAHVLARAAQFLLMFMGIVIGAEQVGVESMMLTVLVTTVVGIALGGAALAFGLGSGLAASNIISAYYLNKTYRVGQTVRIGGIEGRIIDITQTNVVLDSRDGRVLIPARKFSEEASVLIGDDV
jgi:small-conductance mechanosensitive channel